MKIGIFCALLFLSFSLNARELALNAWKTDIKSVQAIIYSGLALMLKKQNVETLGINNSINCSRKINADGSTPEYKCHISDRMLVWKDAEMLHTALYHAVINGYPVKIRGYDYILSDGETFVICEDSYRQQYAKYFCTFY